MSQIPASSLMQRLTSDAVLEEAYTWLCQQRKSWPASADVWAFPRHWPQEKASLQRELQRGTYQMELLTQTTIATGEAVDLWSARDALVMKALTLVLQSVLQIS